MFTVKPREDFLSEKETYNRLHRQQFFDFLKEYSKVSAVRQRATSLDVSFREVFVLLSPPQRLLLVNTSERKIRERGGGALERENGSVGNDGKREKAGALPFSLFPSQSSPRALIFPLPSLCAFFPKRAVKERILETSAKERVRLIRPFFTVKMYLLALGYLMIFSSQLSLIIHQSCLMFNCHLML